MREELKKQKKDRLMVDSESSSEEETCKEMNRLTLDKETEPWVYYEDNILPADKESFDVDSFKDSRFSMINSQAKESVGSFRSQVISTSSISPATIIRMTKLRRRKKGLFTSIMTRRTTPTSKSTTPKMRTPSMR